MLVPAYGSLFGLLSSPLRAKPGLWKMFLDLLTCVSQRGGLCGDVYWLIFLTGNSTLVFDDTGLSISKVCNTTRSREFVARSSTANYNANCRVFRTSSDYLIMLTMMNIHLRSHLRSSGNVWDLFDDDFPNPSSDTIFGSRIVRDFMKILFFVHIFPHTLSQLTIRGVRLPSLAQPQNPPGDYHCQEKYKKRQDFFSLAPKWW